MMKEPIISNFTETQIKLEAFKKYGPIDNNQEICLTVKAERFNRLSSNCGFWLVVYEE